MVAFEFMRARLESGMGRDAEMVRGAPSGMSYTINGRSEIALGKHAMAHDRSARGEHLGIYSCCLCL